MSYSKRIKIRLFLTKDEREYWCCWISFNVIKNCLAELSDILRYVFNLSLQTRIFPDPLKIAKVTPVFKTGDLMGISNYRPISFLPCSSKILECIIHNRLYSYLVNKKKLYSKQFDFQKSHSIEHAAVSWNEFMNHLETTITHLGFLLIYPRPLTLLTMQYY